MSTRLCVRIVCVVASILGLAATGRADTTDPAGGSQPHNEVQPSLALTYLIRAVGDPQDLGEVILFTGNYAPQGYFIADGRSLSVATYGDLFSRIGTTFGGDGVNTFNLPDLTGRTAIGTGTTDAGTTFALGETRGSGDVALTVGQLPAHTHTYDAGQTGSTGGGAGHDNYQPSLALNFGIVAEGIFPSPSLTLDGEANTDITYPARIGFVKSFATSLPGVTFAADGAVIDISTSETLFNIIGTTFGGDGNVTYAMPDLAGRAAMHAGSALGLTPRTLGQTVGSELSVLNVDQLPAHNHGVNGSTTGDTGGGQPHDNMQPTLTLNYIIATTGVFPSSGTGNAYVGVDPMYGEIALFAGNFAPRGWALANGQILPIASNQALFSILGTTYGGDGIVNFALPDLRGRIPVGADYLNPGLNPLLSLDSPTLGYIYGHEAHTLTLDELPSHVHGLDGAVVPTPAAASLLAPVALAMLARRRRREANLPRRRTM